MSQKSAKEIEDKDKCTLCGSVDNDLETDHLRECYKTRQSTLDGSMYKPRLFEDEIGMLQGGFNVICSNRAKCRKRQAAKSITAKNDNDGKE